MDDRLEKISSIIEALKKQIFSDCVDITDVMDENGIRRKKVSYGHRNELLGDTSDWEIFTAGSVWGEPDGHELFRVSVTVPEKYTGKEVFFFLSTGAEDIWNTDNPQMLVYVNGKRRCGMDMNHNCISIYDKNDWTNKVSRQVDIAVYAYSNLAENGNYMSMSIAARDETAKDTYFDMKVPFDGAKAMLGLDSRKNAIDLLSDKESLKAINPVDPDNARRILDALSAAGELLESKDGRFTEKSMQKAMEYLNSNLYGASNGVTVASVGHTHIDVAWKWPIRQTREKVIRSYSTVMELMKRYPEYLFMASTPQMYEFVREDEPELFEEIREKVREKRFEPEGAMWLEADCNLTSGESLIRQILYGKKYFKDVFDVDSDILWLPDVFGYSAAMPQILKKSGIRAFVTTKLAWNDTNRMPHDLFWWKGIDGSKILTYIITTCDLPRADLIMREGGILNYTYNGRQDVSQIAGTWRAFREKDITNEVLTCYGFGDGGGGPTWEMLEMDRRLRKGIPGCPRTVQKSVSKFMNGLIQKTTDNDKVPVWNDELYLEFHRGTYTSIGKNKKNNRKLEILLREAEVIGVLEHICGASEYPADKLYDVWKTLMLNQFHDILPGSSIEEVYKDSDIQYKKAICDVIELIEAGTKAIDLADICRKKPVTDVLSENDEKKPLTGMSVVDNGSSTIIDTKFYTISFDENAEISSLYDKEAGRELRDIKQHPLNRLIAFKDEPQEYDAWNIDVNFEDISFDITNVDSYELEKHTVLHSEDEISEVVLHIRRKFRDSIIWQDIVVKNDFRQIDFVTRADWHEHQTLLKAAFPVKIDSKEITCEIQYGDIKRNLTRDNSWDKAKFECCAHRWIDISENRADGYGAAIINDCKYGYDAKENLMRLTLIKSGIFPNPNADQGVHEFTYALLPHKGDHRKGRVIEAAEKLNNESLGYLNKLGIDYSELVSSMIRFEDADGVYVGAFKMAEDQTGVVVRLYEGHGVEKEVKAIIFENMPVVIKSVKECDLLEKDMVSDLKYSHEDREISFALNAYEIKTIKIEIK